MRTCVSHFVLMTALTLAMACGGVSAPTDAKETAVCSQEWCTACAAANGGTRCDGQVISCSWCGNDSSCYLCTPVLLCTLSCICM